MNEVAPEFSLARERAVARRHTGRIEWEMLLVGFGQFTVWLIVFILGIRGEISLWLGFPLAVLCCCVAYLPSHEAQHGNIAGRREYLGWLNDLLGHVSLLPLSFPYGFARATHMKHHAFTNDAERDFDHHYVLEYWWQAALAVHRDPPREMLEQAMADDPVFQKDLMQGALVKKLFSFVMVGAVLLWPLPTFFLWWLPQKIGMSYLTIFFSWMPHRPGVERGRYEHSQFWRTRFVPRYFVQSMTHHALHHLYPRIPHWGQPAALKDLKPFIVARQMKGAEILADYR